MRASDAPLFLAMACELFVEELTLLSWQVVEDGRRKTMQKVGKEFSYRKMKKKNIISVRRSDGSRFARSSRLSRRHCTEGGEEIFAGNTSFSVSS